MELLAQYLDMGGVRQGICCGSIFTPDAVGGICSTVESTDAIFGSDSDASALLEFKASVMDRSGLLSSWDSSKASDHCSCSGVACDSTSCVVALNIGGGGGGI
ncbi:LRR receptor-like serine/threonine-protein kinase RPK2 [Coffea arabica]|uniref:LRR receptor-like serine/threonine-protein kinase RPK2 n=1 Tax=Coffea arabica TaxID=13443 RepID=A0ABM4UI81_COFAR